MKPPAYLLEVAVRYVPQRVINGSLTYFRKTVNIPGLTFLYLPVGRSRDDGIVLYKRHRVYRDNMPAGPMAHGTLRQQPLLSDDSATLHVVNIPPSAFIAGNKCDRRRSARRMILRVPTCRSYAVTELSRFTFVQLSLLPPTWVPAVQIFCLRQPCTTRACRVPMAAIFLANQAKQ